MRTRSILSALSLAALTVQGIVPLAMAALPCTVTVADTVAGLGTDVTVIGCEASTSTILTVHSSSDPDYTQTIALDALGNATTLIPSRAIVTAGSYEVRVAGATTSFTVLPDRANEASSSIVVSPQVISADGREAATVTAILRDRYDNPVAGRPLALIGSRLTDDVTPMSTQTDDQGRFLWTVRSTEAGQTSLIVYDIAGGHPIKLRTVLTVGTVRGPSSPFRASLGFGGDDTVGTSTTAAVGTAAIARDDATRFEIALTQGGTTVKSNEFFGLTVRAKEGSDTVRSFVGTLIVTSSDPDAILPKKGDNPSNPLAGRIDMRGVDQGERTIALAFMLRKGGTQTITVSDANDPRVTGTLTLAVDRDDSAAGDRIVILDPADRSSVKGGPILLQGRAPSLINLIVKGGSQPVQGESDSEGVFRISVPLHPADKEVTLFVTSENGTYESAPIHVLIDSTPPTISTVNFVPPETKAGEKATINVSAEPDLAAVTATIDGQTIALVSASGSLYTGTISAPKDEGQHDVTVAAKDRAGNETTLLVKWNVQASTLPRVEGVKAEGKQASVALSWQAVDLPNIREYRIYIATEEEPTNYLYSVSTKQAVQSAVIKDLPRGKRYLFSLTAVSTDNIESTEKSEPAAASPLGLDVRVSAGKDSLMLEWSPIPSLPLDHYILRYGTESDQYTEERSINGESRSTVLRDLIGGITYEIQLSPVTVTGKELTEFATVVRGTPTSDGFAAVEGEKLPSDLTGHGGAPLDPRPELEYVPENTGSGLPSFAIGILFFTALAFGLHWNRLRLERRQANHFLAVMRDRYLS